MRIKHKNMRDVAAEILEKLPAKTEGKRRYKVLWINLLGTHDHPEPFPIGTRNGLAIEEIEINPEEWEVVNATL